MVEPFFLAVTRTPSIGPCCPVTWPESPGSACAATAPEGEVASAPARPAAVDNSTCFIRMMITPWYVFLGSLPDFQPPDKAACVGWVEPLRNPIRGSRTDKPLMGFA